MQEVGERYGRKLVGINHLDRENRFGSVGLSEITDRLFLFGRDPTMTRRLARKKGLVKQLQDFIYVAHRAVIEVVVLILLLIEVTKIIDSEVHIGRLLCR
jgi:hypothetical protein